MGNRTHIGIKDFKTINWLPTRERFQQCVCVGAYKFCNNSAPFYMSDVYKLANNTHNTRRSAHGLYQPAKNTNFGKKGLSYLGPKFWNSLSSDIKSSKNTISFKQAIKNNFLTNWNMQKMIVFYIIQNAVANILACCKVSFVNFISNGTAIGTHFLKYQIFKKRKFF